MNPLAWLYLGWFWLNIKLAQWQVTSPLGTFIACLR